MTKHIHTSLTIHHTSAIRAEHGQSSEIHWLNLYLRATPEGHRDLTMTIFIEDPLYAARLAQAINEAYEPPRLERVAVLDRYSVSNGRITSPGKFEGLPVYAPYYWNRALEGGADSDDNNFYTFNITPTDRRIWPELEGVDQIILTEADNGFVHILHNSEDPTEAATAMDLLERAGVVERTEPPFPGYRFKDEC